MIPELGLFDFCLAFIYLFLIYIGAFVYKNKKIETNPEYKYFILGLTAKIIGGIGFAVFSIYYYKGGDTFVFFNAAEGLRQMVFSDFGSAVDVYFLNAKDFSPVLHSFAPRYNYILGANDVLSIVKITSLINIFAFGSYLSSSILFAFFSFLGLWFGYSNFCKLYPLVSKYMLIPFFLVPSALLWSSGILKDTVTIGVVGWMLYAFSNLFIFKRKFLFSLIVIIIGTLLLLVLKPYILYVLLPCLFVWVQTSIKKVVSGSFIRMLLKPLIIIALVFSGYFLTQAFSESAGKYRLENIENALRGFQSWHTYLANNYEQSGYSLGEMELTPFGILKKSPAALNVTFFRPYLWEVRNMPTLLGAFESLMLLSCFVYLLIKARLKFFKFLFKNKEVLFSMMFALVFGIMVGISSYNFGALSRYKIPAQFFFLLAIVLIWYEHNKELNRIENR